MNGHRKPVQTPAHPCNNGFTLIEVLIVISIIALLIGLLVPAVMNAMRSARDAEVRTEISQLDAAITTFQAEYGGIAPPSRITFPNIWEDETWFARDKAIIRRIWPQFDFGSNGGAGTDFHGTLNGAECLVFFLGGIGDGSGALIGFSKNPALPFKTGGNRVGPFFEFDTRRITPTGQGTSGNPKAPEYFDPLPGQTTPYLYLSSYDGRGYVRQEAVNLGMCYAYLQPGLFEDLNCNGILDSGEDQSPTNSVLDVPAAWKANSHQIISPGADTRHGNGGVYDPDDESTLAEEERDNITNFSRGRLVP